MTPKWIVTPRRGEPQEFADASDAAGFITSNDDYIDELDVNPDEYIDECYPAYEICGETIYGSEILSVLRPYTYSEVQDEERRSLAESNVDWVAETLGNMDSGEETRFEGGISVLYLEEPDEEELNGLDHEEFNDLFSTPAEDFNSLFDDGSRSDTTAKETQKEECGNVLEGDHVSAAVD